MSEDPAKYYTSEDERRKDEEQNNRLRDLAGGIEAEIRKRKLVEVDA